MAKSPLLDFKKFKYVKSDDKSTTLQHAQGHTVNIVHGVLSKDNQAQLKAMADAAKQPIDKSNSDDDKEYGKVIMKADGGQVAPPDPDKAKAMASTIKATESDKALSNAVKHPIDTLTKALGFADGGDVDAYGYPKKPSTLGPPAAPSPDKAKGFSSIFKAEGGDVSAPEALQSNDEYSKSHPQMPAININLGPGTQPIQAGPGAPMPAQQPPAQPANPLAQGAAAWKSIAAPPVQEAPEQGTFLHPAADSALGKAYGMQQPSAAQPEQPVQDQGAAPVDTAAAQTSEPTGAAAAPQHMPHQAAESTAPQSAPAPAPQAEAQKPGDSFLNQVNAVKQDFDNGHITPKTYSDLFAQKSTLGKIGTIFGLLVSGAGSGLTGQKNALLDMMDKTIQNDLDAQEKSKSHQMNFMQLAEQHLMNQANIQHLGAENAHLGAENNLAAAQARQSNIAATGAARDLAYQLQARSAFHEMSVKAASMPEGPAKQQAMQALGIMSQGLDMKAMQAADALNAKAALTQGMMGAMGTNPSDDSSFQAQQRQLRLTGHDDLAKDNESKYMPGLGRASTPLTSDDREKLRAGLQFGSELQRYAAFAKQHSGTIDPKVVGQGKALAAELQGAYRQATNGGVYKAGEQKFLENLVDSDPTKFFNNLRVMPKIDAIAREHDAKMHTLMKTYGFQGEMPKASSPEIKTLNGVKYQKAPGGWQKIQ